VEQAQDKDLKKESGWLHFVDRRATSTKMGRTNQKYPLKQNCRKQVGLFGVYPVRIKDLPEPFSPDSCR
jgi:hypothetical protein